MKTRLLTILLITGLAFLSGFVSVYAVMYECTNPPLWVKHPRSGFAYCFGLLLDGHIIDYNRNLDYDPLCETGFWMNVTKSPNEFYTKTVMLDALNVQGLEFTADDISFYKNDSLFVANVKGDWGERSSVVISLTDTLEKLDEVIAVNETRIACA
ncbi:hypothetical protein [Nitrosopumilus sp.]|uniref:hypothetical protein n=1 Tax=Nitrosopumilus sp. TaxID=2024843 RepID=UPI00247C4762|nr:hypothetical protein [Nitrosopumilus sp.]MCV0409654.1 hypothetical protein [Nitrosopumilus sp.]